MTDGITYPTRAEFENRPASLKDVVLVMLMIFALSAGFIMVGVAIGSA